MVWTLVEPGIATIAASLVTIRPLLRAFKIHGFESNESTRPPPPPINGETPLILRADWNSNATNISSKGDELDRSLSLGAIQRFKMGKGNVDVDEEEVGGGSGIRRTVMVRVHSGRASSRSENESLEDDTSPDLSGGSRSWLP
jgi:hypothetical protein